MDRWVGKVAVVTGASAGIGASICKALVKKGVKVAGLARRVEKIEELSKTLCKEPGKLYALRCDVTKEDDILKSFKWIIGHLGPVHILVNNAGLARPNNLIDGNTKDWHQVVDVNVIGLCICTREAIRSMRENSIAGHIIHINSITGHQVWKKKEPNLNIYSATKFAVTALTELLRQELMHNNIGIKVTSISPGVVTTEFFNIFSEDITDLPQLDPDDIAEAAIYVLSTGPSVQVHELTIKPLGEPF